MLHHSSTYQPFPYFRFQLLRLFHTYFNLRHCRVYIHRTSNSVTLFLQDIRLRNTTTCLGPSLLQTQLELLRCDRHGAIGPQESIYFVRIAF